MSQPLFRHEVLDAQRGSWLGAISLAQPLRAWVLTGFAAAAALAIAAFLFAGHYTRRARVSGHLVPSLGLASVLAPASGVVERLDVNEGGQVAQGQTLAVLHIPRAAPASGNTAEALAERLERRQHSLQQSHGAQTRLLDAQGSGLARQLASARQKLTQLHAEIATRQQQAQLAHDTLQQMQRLAADKFVSALQIKQQQAAHLQAVSEVQVLQRQATAAQRHIAQLQQALQELPGQRQANSASYQRDLALLEQEQLETEARGQQAIHAPLAGTVAAQLVKAGQAVQAGQPLFSLLPGNGELEAELWVPSHAIGFIEPGDTVLLRYQAYPYQKFGHQEGKVKQISRSALNQSELQSLLGSAMQAEPMYRITVVLARQRITAYGKAEPLKPGMLLEADILGERRSLIEWVLEPLYSVKGRLST